MKDKIKTREEAAKIVTLEKAAGKKVGFTNGCFDILHLGHVRYLNETKKDCDVLVVGLNSDGSVNRLKGDERPMNGQDSRAEVLAALESVDLVTVFDEDTPEELIKVLTPDMLFKGGDWKEKEIVGAEHVKGAGGKVKVIFYVEGYSTTKFIEKIKKEASS
ncbi:MAG: D-glycero-beta-D-manno-heptose 1-phosphate adenylyltransferase [Candidatus Tantalella remota]|nr:D-glycero-beta-D-manno-heptose 1-phosphate adenylyltransferase [Candidatus Tantalella remota]